VMEGRWTIYQCPATGRVGLHDSFRTCDCPAPFKAVPVVPCDDAALERGAEALIRIAKRWGMGDWQPTGARELAAEVLRAAGETS